MRSRAHRARIGANAAYEIVRGTRRAYPQAPETAARRLRVLGEIGALAWYGSGADRELGVVSSEGTDLERSPAFVAYRERYEEGIRYLSEATPSS